MYTCCKVPPRGLGRATRSHPKFNNTQIRGSKVDKALITTIARLSTAPPRKPSSPAKERQRAEREQLTRLLKESPGKRDARNFLKHFDAPKAKKTEAVPAIGRDALGTIGISEGLLERSGVNLGKLYKPSVFTHELLPEKGYEEDGKEPSHVALVKLRAPQALDDQTLGGIALTLSQMARLGLNTAVILDCEDVSGDTSARRDVGFDHNIMEQGSRLLAALEEYNEPGALVVEHALSYSSRVEDTPSSVQVRGRVKVQNNFLLYPPIDDGVIPIILPFAHDQDLKKVRVAADDVVLALVRELVGMPEWASVFDPLDRVPNPSSHKISHTQRPTLDRIIVLDALGGIPSAQRSDGAHVFVNLEAEYRDIERELRQLSITNSERASSQRTEYLGSGNPFSKFFGEELVSLPSPPPRLPEGSAPVRHLKNLEVIQRALNLLPAASSGLILTPSEAATKAISEDIQSAPRKNPLLHNILTDRPRISSSLPTKPTSKFLGSAMPNPPTFFKKGVPLTMIPDPRKKGPWRPPSAFNPSIELDNDHRIDFPKLEALINDSFRRKLDAKDYLNRIRGRVAGIIVAGDYEGGAICTWETPKTLLKSQVPDLAAETCDSPYWIPYLDKFAVLTSSQGSGGVSDIVWSALTRSCFPEGVVWRSRTSNPVNKWYQERSRGTWNLPGDQWTMFWTTENVTEAWAKKWGAQSEEGKSMTRWDAYVDVCSGIQPSWADGIQRAD